MEFATIVVDQQYQETEALYEIASETCSFDSRVNEYEGNITEGRSVEEGFEILDMDMH